MPNHLTITPTPFKSSLLAIPHSPFSPRSPLTPLPSAPKRTHQTKTKKPTHTPLDLPTPPTNPLPWLWQCHLCNRCYQLGVTRRCLEDGHFFCSGTTTVKRSKRGRAGGRKVTKHHQACASEFDYQAWKAWGEWKRGVLERVEAAGLLEEWLERGDWPLREPGAVYEGSAFGRMRNVEREKDCWRECNYPSECRWGKQFGVQSPRVVVPSSQASSSQLPVPQITELQPCFEDIVLNDFESDLLSDSGMVPHLHEEEAKKPSMDDLLASAKRRKRRSMGMAASPLASNPPSCSSSTSSSNSMGEEASKASDDSELDSRKSLGRVEGLVSYLIRGKNGWDVLEDRKLEAGGKRSKYGRKKSAESF